MFAQAPKFIAPKNSKILSIHGHNRSDDYYWMNERDSKAVLENLKQ
jgi:protease II